MIKKYISQTYDGIDPLPNYAANRRTFTLIGSIAGGYKITLARLTVGNSVSGNKILFHALFESFTDHGERARTSRTRSRGADGEFTAVKTAMSEAGVEFDPSLPCPCEIVMRSLGERFTADNPEILGFSVVSQTCH